MSVKFQLEGIDYSSLKGKAVLIVGEARSLGLASGLSLAQAGARVTIADNIPHTDVVKAFRSRGLAVQYVRCDVTSWSQQLMAFKQAIQFSPSRTLDIVCSFLQVDLGQDLIEDATQAEPRIDTEPVEPVMDEVDMNIRAVCHLTKLAMHFFGILDRTTALKRARSRSGSIVSTITASSVRSRSNSRSGSRRGSRSGSRSGSPVQSPPVQESGEPVVITEEPEQKDEAAPEQSPKEKPQEKQVEFTKSLIIVGGMAAYVDYGQSNFLAASAFALRGLFRSLRAKSMKELAVRVNLVSPWAVRSPSIEPRLKELEEDGFIEREAPEEKSEAVKNDKEAAIASPSPAAETSDEAVNGNKKEEGPDSKVDTAAPQPSGDSDESASNTQETRNAEDATVATGVNGTATDNGEENRAETTEANQDNVANVANGEVKEKEANSKAKESAEVEKTEHSNGVVDDKSKEAESTTEPEQLVKYKDLHFASVDDIVSTVTRMCADSSISGRSIAVMPEGAFDLQDDYQGGYAGQEVMKLLNMRKEAGDVIYKLLNLVPEPTTSSD